MERNEVESYIDAIPEKNTSVGRLLSINVRIMLDLREHLEKCVKFLDSIDKKTKSP